MLVTAMKKFDTCRPKPQMVGNYVDPKMWEDALNWDGFEKKGRDHAPRRRKRANEQSKMAGDDGSGDLRKAVAHSERAGKCDGEESPAKRRRMEEAEGHKVDACSSCLCRDGKKTVSICGERLEQYKCSDKPIEVISPFGDLDDEVRLCKPCAMDWKALLAPNKVQARTRFQEKTVSRLKSRQNRHRNITDRDGEQRKCSLCVLGEEMNESEMNESATRYVWTPRFIKSLSTVHVNGFVTAISDKLKIKRGEVKKFVCDYEQQLICLKHSNTLYAIMEGFKRKDTRCSIKGCGNQVCRTLRVPTDPLSFQYLRMVDAYAEIKVSMGVVDKRSGGITDEDVNIAELDGKLICTSHLWAITRSGRVLNRNDRPVGSKGLASLTSNCEVRTAVWVREYIFGTDDKQRGNNPDCKVVFCADAYAQYKKLCLEFNEAPKTKRVVINNLTDVLSVFRIFVKTGKIMGRGNPFFYNESQVVLSAARTVQKRRDVEHYIITDIGEENDLMRILSMRYRFERESYERADVDLANELSKIDSRLYTTVAVRLCTRNAMERHRRRARLYELQSVYEIWPLSNKEVPAVQIMRDEHLRFSVRVCYHIEQTVLIKHVNAQGAFTTLIGMACMIGCRTKLHYVLNRIGVSPSYDQMHRLKNRLASENIANGKPILTNLKPHRLAIFAVDNIDTTNRHGIVVHGRTEHGLHMTGIQAVFSLLTDTDQQVAINESEMIRKRDGLTDSTAFIDSHVPRKDDVDIGVYVRIVIGAIYHYQHRLCTDDLSEALSITKLLLSMFKGYNNVTDIRYADVMNINTGSRGSVDEAVHRIDELYGKEAAANGMPTVVEGDQPTFRELFRIMYESFEYGKGDAWKWMVPIPGMFHCLKVAVWDIIKWLTAGTGVEEFLKDSGLSESQQKRFAEYGHARRNRHFYMQFMCASIIQLCETVLEDDEGLLHELSELTEDVGSQDPAKIPIDCKIELDCNGGCTQAVYETGCLFYDQFQRIASNAQSRNAQFHIGTVLIGLLIPSTAYYVFGRLGQAAVLDKFLFNIVPTLHRSAKLPYSELLLHYAFVKSVMCDDLYYDLYERNPSSLTVGSRDRENKTASLFHDECLEMGIVRHMKSMDFRAFEQYRHATSWLKQFCSAYDKLAQLAGDRVGGTYNRRYDDFAEVDSLRQGYDRTKAQALNVKRMVQRMKNTGHLGNDFIHAEHISNFATGEVVTMNDIVAEDMLKNAHDDGRVLAGLFSKALLPRRFGHITQEEADIWLKGKVPKRWSLAPVALNFEQWTTKFGTAAERSRLGKGDSIKTLAKTRRTREVYRNCVLQLMKNGPTRAIRESASIQLERMSSYVSVRSYAWRSTMALDSLYHSSKSEFWRTLSAELDCDGGAKFLLEGSTGFPNNVCSVHMDLMNLVYQCPQRNYQFRSIRDCMLNTIAGRLWNLLSSRGQARLNKLFFHCDTESVMIKQKKFEQRRRSVHRTTGTDLLDSDRCPHDFDEDLDFSWLEVTSQQREKNIFASLYVFLSAIAVTMIGNRVKMDNTHTPIVCDSYLCGADFVVSSGAIGSHVSTLMSLRVDSLLPKGDKFIDGHVAIVTGHEYQDLQSVEWIRDPRLAWTVSSSGIFERAPQYDSLHSEAETRIPYIIAENGKQPNGDCTLVISKDSDCPAITLLNNSLRHFNVVHRVADQYIYIDILHDKLEKIGLLSDLVTRAFITGGCDFVPFLKHVAQRTFAKVIVHYGKFLTSIYSLLLQDEGYQISGSTCTFTELLVCLAFLECNTLTGAHSSTSITRPPTIPDASTPLNSLPSWIHQFRDWQHESVTATSLHHLLPFPDGMELHDARVRWVLRYWSCSTRPDCNDHTENQAPDVQHGYTSEGAPIIDDENAVDSRSQQMSRDVHRCNCFKGCRRSCPCQRKGHETACLVCGCCYKRNGMEPPLRKNMVPLDCENKYNSDEHWDKVSEGRSSPQQQYTSTHQDQHLIARPSAEHHVVEAQTRAAPSNEHDLLPLRADTPTMLASCVNAEGNAEGNQTHSYSDMQISASDCPQQSAIDIQSSGDIIDELLHHHSLSTAEQTEQNCAVRDTNDCQFDELHLQNSSDGTVSDLMKFIVGVDEPCELHSHPSTANVTADGATVDGRSTVDDDQAVEVFGHMDDNDASNHFFDPDHDGSNSNCPPLHYSTD